MTTPADHTCWDMIQGAAEGDAAARREFAQTYLPVVRAYLGARWRRSGYITELEDAVQDVFVDCFRERGALGRVDPERNVKFRTFLYGVVRNVALRHEERTRKRERQPASVATEGLEAREERLSVAFDRAWARALVKRALARYSVQAREEGKEDRIELLRQRFSEGKPIRDIAKEWERDPAELHRRYRQARQEFKKALLEEVRMHNPGNVSEIEHECASLLALLGE